MGKKCVRLALASAAVGLLVMGGAQSSQAQTAEPGIGTILVYTSSAGGEGLALDSAGNIYLGFNSGIGLYKSTYSNGSYTTAAVTNSPQGWYYGVAVDSTGNVYLADENGTGIWKAVGSGGTYTFTNIIPSPGFSAAGMAVDAYGNLYTNSYSAGTVYKYILSGGVYTQHIIASGLDVARNMAIDPNGVIYQAIEEGGTHSEGMVNVYTPSGSVATTTTYTATTLYECTDLCSGVAVKNGVIYIGDGTQVIKESPNGSGGYTQTIESTGYTEIRGMAVDNNGNVLVSDLGTDKITKVTTTLPDFGSVAVGTTSTQQSIAFEVLTAGTFGTPLVLTKGASGLDFKLGTGSTCVGTLAANTACVVNVTFTPKYPGERYGAVELTNSSGALITTSLMQGNGTGPEAVFANTTTGVYLPSAQNTLGGGFSNPEAVAVDGSGNVYVADFTNSVVKETPAGCASSSCVTTLGSGFSNPTGVAVDGAGNVYVADFGHSLVKEMVAVNGSIPASPTINTLGGGFSQAEGVAVDGNGNVFVGDTSNNAVKVMPSGCSSSSCVTSLGGGFSNPSGVAVDGLGNVFVADTNNSAVKEMPVGCTSSSCVTTLSSGFSSPQGVAVDSSGNVYVADTYHGAVKEMVAVGGRIPASPTILTLGSGFGLPFGVALDGSGNVYVADNSNNAVKKLDFVDPPSFSFANTYVFSVSADSPKTETITNIGNTALTFEVPGSGDNPAISSGFTIGNSSTCPQLTTLSSAGTLAAGVSCTDLLSFAPQLAGTNSGSTVTKDNTLNVANSTQSVGLSGTALPLTKTITFPQPTTPVTAGSSATLTAYTSSSDPVTYTVTAGAATINGSTIIYTNTGTVTIAANSAQTADYLAAATVSVNVVVNAAATSYAAPATPESTTSAPQTAAVTFNTSGTLSAINVVTAGVTGLDFKFVPGGTCATGTPYTAGQTCTVDYTFTPAGVGQRQGAIMLYTTASPSVPVGTSFLAGTGTGTSDCLFIELADQSRRCDSAHREPPSGSL
jgi:sugar lactone lactonase YvrE